MRSSQPGNHQLASPSSSIVDGTITMRISVASMKIALAKPMPNSLMMMLSPSTNDRKNVHMIAAAAVMTRAVADKPSATAVVLFAGAQVLLPDAREQEHLVVHREAEQDREHHDRQERLDRPFLADAHELFAPAPLEDQRRPRRTPRRPTAGS